MGDAAFSGGQIRALLGLLCPDAAAYINGQVIGISGGRG
jgi:hypothetical protein